MRDHDTPAERRREPTGDAVEPAPEDAVRSAASGLSNSALSALLRRGPYDERDVMRATVMRQLQRAGGNRAVQAQTRAGGTAPSTVSSGQEVVGFPSSSTSAGLDAALVGAAGGPLEHTPSRPLIHRQSAPASTPAPPPQEEKRYKVMLSTGTFEDLTEAEAVAKLSESYDSLSHEVEQDAGHHEILQKDRASNVAVGAGGFIADLFIGRDLPPVSIWEKPRNLLTAAKLALGSGAVQEAGDALKQAGDAYRESRAKWRTYNDDLELEEARPRSPSR